MAAVASPVSTVGSVHVNRPLTDFSLGYHPDTDSYIGEKIFKVVPVQFESDDYYIWDRAQAFRLEQNDGYGTMVADGTPSKREDYGTTLAQYNAKAFKLSTQITDRTKRNADSVLRLEQAKTRRLQAKIMMEQELRIANLLTTTSNYASTNYHTYAGTAQWNNASFASSTGNVDSVIKQNIDDACEAIRQQTGMAPNTIIIPEPVRRVMSRDVGLLNELRYTRSGLLNTDKGDIIGDSLWGMTVLNPKGIYTTAVEGEAFSSVDIWGKCVIVAYVTSAPQIDEPSLGYIFRSRPWQVKSWREEQTESTIYEPSIIQDEKMISNVCGYLLNTVIA